MVIGDGHTPGPEPAGSAHRPGCPSECPPQSLESSRSVHPHLKAELSTASECSGDSRLMSTAPVQGESSHVHKWGWTPSPSCPVPLLCPKAPPSPAKDPIAAPLLRLQSLGDKGPCWCQHPARSQGTFGTSRREWGTLTAWHSARGPILSKFPKSALIDREQTSPGPLPAPLGVVIIAGILKGKVSRGSHRG